MKTGRETSRITFRMPRTSDELLALLRVRYYGYRNSPHHMFVHETAEEIDVDAWDVRSHHFGLYRDASPETPLGYVRLVTAVTTPHAALLSGLSSRSLSVLQALSATPSHALPCFSYFPGTEEVEALHEGLQTEGCGFVEPSRMTLAPEERRTRIGSFLVPFIAAFCHGTGMDRAILTCRPDHAPLYLRMGFRLAPGTVRGIAPGCPVDHCLTAEWNSLSPRVRTSIDALASQWVTRRHISLDVRESERPIRRPAGRSMASPANPSSTVPSSL